MLVSGGAQLEMEADSDDDGGQLTGHVQAGGGPLPSRPDDVFSALLAGHTSRAPDSLPALFSQPCRVYTQRSCQADLTCTPTATRKRLRSTIQPP